ncbi:hypothetical protein [Saccharothrix sp. Mg75]|uniref:hypothetical protein n=1 Tax=Saccharothrix sp. Mg75 TaxID=3445357 RepID=UPI003EE8C0F5
MDDLPRWGDRPAHREAVLERVLEQAFDLPEVRRVLAAGELTEQDLRDEVADAGPVLFAAAATQEEQYGWSAAQRTPLPVGLLKAVSVTPTGVLLFAWTASAVGLPGVPGLPPWALLPTMVGLVAVPLVAVVGAMMAKFSWGGALGSFGLVLAVFVLLGLPAVPALVLLLVSWSAAVFLPAALRASRRRALADERRAEALLSWSGVLLEDGVLPVLYARINEVTRTSYSTVLTVRETSALTRANPLRMHVVTPAGVRLARLVSGLDGGSFAVAGPRGAGKTHLLRAFCGGRYQESGRAPDLAVLVSAPVEYASQEFAAHLFAEVCQAVVARFGQPKPGRRGWRRRVLPHPLVSAAREHLSLLAYVRTYANEVSGKGGFKGLELAGKRAWTMTGRPLTHPEVVKGLRDFLSRVVVALSAESGAAPGRVIIAIDELDRIGTGEPARRFLNEIKAVFDVPGCHYLVSVSTEAQHDFELSGIGLRSVFDSSFDEVVRVDYLDLAYAQKLLQRYVLGLSAQFQALAHVFSGGLARQLVRTARAVVEQGRERRGSLLSEVVRAFATDELIGVRQVAADALAVVDDRAGATGLLRLLDEHPGTRPDDLDAYRDRVLSAYPGTSEQVGRLRDAVAARAAFLSTAVKIFTDDLDGARMQAVDFDELARARRYCDTNPEAGIGLLDDITRRWDR